ncbi:MAG: hypothetical protein INR72_12065 [Williamsia herbipolensis]|nr:hypothetical protein [Williamsia herbipolensis]
MQWWVWAIALVVLVGAGLGLGWTRTRRPAQERTHTAWADARAALESARISRDAADPLPEAERLLDRAEVLASHRGGRRAATTVQRLASDADRLFRVAQRP